MSIDKVKKYFKEYNMEDRVIELNESSATVYLAALALGCSEKEIAKSLSFMVNDKPILVIVAGDARIDNHKFKEEFFEKAKMIPYEEVENYIGHAAGGVCPFAINDGVDVFLDTSLKALDYVYPACGSSSSAIKLSIPEMEKYSNYLKWVDVCKEN